MRFDNPLPPNDLPKPRVQIDEFMVLVSDCEENESKLTPWEREFIDSIKHQIPRGLSEKQVNRLMVIWTKVTT